MNSRKTLIISIVILAISVIIVTIIFLTEPTAQREGASIKTAMLVDVVNVNKGDYTPLVVATGTVTAAKDIMLSSQVGGEVVRISENFIPGSFVEKGELLLQINPADYRNTLQLRKSDLRLAQADLSIEMGRQDVARKDYELVGQEMSSENQALVLRKPQLEAARANVAAAQAAVDQAELSLQRTAIRAPFDAHIISRNTNVGSQVTPGVEIGRLAGIEEYWIVANIPTAKVHWLNFAEDQAASGANVKILNNSWPAGRYRAGKLFRLVGALDEDTRLARVLISVTDPLARQAADTIPKLMIGTFVETRIEARELEDVIRLDRDYLRKGETVWVMKNGKLLIRNVEVLLQDAEYAYISNGLSDDDKVVTTDLSTVVEGSELRVEGDTTVKQPSEEEKKAKQHE